VSGRVAWALIGVMFGAPALAIVASDEAVRCQIDNVRDGYFRTPDFASDVVISGNERAKRLDFTKLRQFGHICVGYLYAPGFPQGSRWMMENVKQSGPRACWRDGENFLTVGGVGESGITTWTQVTLSGPRQWYQMAGESCVETADAVIRCEDDTCRWEQQQQ
jgi:hypothetical protein